MPHSRPQPNLDGHVTAVRGGTLFRVQTTAIDETSTLTIPLGTKTLVSINQLTAKGQWYRAKHAAAWRQAGQHASIQAGLPTGLDYIQIDAFIYKPRLNRYDTGNLHPVLKWAIDGMVDYGLIPDDNWTHLDGPHIHHGGKDKNNPRIELVITEKENPYA